MANEIKKYASLENLQTFKENADELYATQTSVDNLSTSVDTKLAGKANSSHTHKADEFRIDTPLGVLTGATLEEVLMNADEEISNLSSRLAGKADTSHTHDDRYYTETEIDTKISTLNSAIAGKSDAHDHPYLSTSTNYAGSTSVGGAANSANAINITRLTDQVTTIAANMALRTELIHFAGSDGKTLGCPQTYCIINFKKGDNHRTILDCYHLNTGDHYINGCMNTSEVATNPWTGWVLQPNQTTIDTALASKADSTHNHDSKYDAKGSASAVQSNLNTVSDTLDAHTSNADIHFTSAERTKLSGIAAGAQKNTITGVKGGSESSYRTGNVNITAANIGLGNVNNTSDANKPVSTAQQTAIDTALASAKSYTDTKTSGLASTSSVNTSIATHNTSTSAHDDIRALISDLSTAVNKFLDVDDTTTDQLSEVLTLIENNKGTLDSLTTSKINVSDIVNNLTTNSTSKVLSAAQGVTIKGLIDALQTELDSHTHAISDVVGLQSALDGKAASSHGTHVSYSTTAPVMDGTASAGSAGTVARSDHRHPTDTTRASQSDLDALETVVSGKADAEHTHAISEVTNLQSSLDAKVSNTRTVNGKALSSNITLSASDVGAASSSHTHDDRYYTETEVNTLLSGKSDTTHNHDAKYDAKGSASAVLTESKTYTDTKVDELSADVIHIDVTDNEDITDTEVEPLRISIDNYLSTTSTNPVQNKVITAEINSLSSQITPITYGTDDLTAGTSSLTTGTLYFVYE